jgi:hypothetical protein
MVCEVTEVMLARLVVTTLTTQYWPAEALDGRVMV